jgi:hypothetical protein
MRQRVQYLEEEKALKAQLLAMIQSEKLTRTEDGKINIIVGDYKIIVTPRDEKVQVKDIDSKE